METMYINGCPCNAVYRAALLSGLLRGVLNRGQLQYTLISVFIRHVLKAFLFFSFNKVSFKFSDLCICFHRISCLFTLQFNTLIVIKYILKLNSNNLFHLPV